MTKEEYEKLLQSDYWKGFSYSLIKERNFTCEDCGRRFYNQRNKLQVHHLVYRDINPWSYKPEEMVVLCEDCHKKRHGIYSEPDRCTYATNGNDSLGGYTKSYSYSTETKDERQHRSDSYTEADRWGNPNDRNGGNGTSSSYPYPIEPQNRFKWKYVLWGMFLLFALSFGWNQLTRQTTDSSDEQTIEQTRQSVVVERGCVESSTETDKKVQDEISNSHSSHNTKNDVTFKASVKEHPEPANQEEVTTPTTTSSTATSHNDIVPSKEESTPQRELTTIELLERRNHAEVVKQAKRAGVSTEGSTTDILERINHAEVVKQAKRAGVSTEGSTTDILERINHAEVVKQAKRLGVSTEGSTTDILQRINRKEIEQMNW